MTKDILIQYCDMQAEIKDIRKRILKLEDEIHRIEQEGNVYDSVSGGDGGKQHFKIYGYPDAIYSKKKSSLLTNKLKLEQFEIELLEFQNKAEEYIQSISDSSIRTIFRLRYIDGLTWGQVGINMGGGNNEDSVRKAHDRFLEKN
jgi:hypothetical protein